jgi:hypothetical protein
LGYEKEKPIERKVQNMHNAKEGLSRFFKIAVAEGRYASVFIWKDVDVLQERNKLSADVGGYAVTIGYAVSPEGKPCVPRKFAELHLL